MNITITKREYNQFYVYDYFYGPKKIVRYMRMYMGPTLAGIGLYLNYAYSDKVNMYIIGFTLAYGLFYTIKPIIMLLANRAKDETFSYKLSNFKLFVKDRLNEGSINLKKNKLQENKKYFFVKLNNGQTLFFPKEKLMEKDNELFRKYIS
ncbi:MAG: hypothetical protein U9R19_01430 [Bacteroidota bacterium]|nr:hypothetical protein [Bacteroidota bacterium]